VSPQLGQPPRVSVRCDVRLAHGRFAVQADSEFEAGARAIRGTDKYLAVGARQAPVDQDGSIARRRNELRIQRRAFPATTVATWKFDPTPAKSPAS
jgi:hypothetical protein